MFNHIGLKVRDVAASTRFYDAALAALGLAAADGAYGPQGEDPGLYVGEGGPSGPLHIAFTAPDRPSVDRFHAAGLAAGGRDNGPPGLRPDYSPTYYAAFLLDPDGNNIEAVCTAEG